MAEEEADAVAGAGVIASLDGVDYAWAAGPRTEEEQGEVKVAMNMLKPGSMVWCVPTYCFTHVAQALL